MAQYKLIYFNIRARGELARLIFQYKQQKFEDYRIEFSISSSSEWAKMKPTTPLGTLPILEINENGKLTKLSQSRAICRYLANTFDIAGKCNLEKAKVDEIVDQINDEFDQLARLTFEKDEDKKLKERKRMFEVIVPNNLRYFENLLKANNIGYLVGSGLTWAE